MAAGPLRAPLALGELEDYDHDRALSLRAARHLVKNHKRQPVHADVMRRWARTGCCAGGTVLVLPTRKVGGVIMTMPSWVEAFRKARERLGERPPLAPVERPARSRRAAAKRAGAALDRAGIRIVETD